MALAALVALKYMDYAITLKKKPTLWAIFFAILSMGILFSGSRTGLALLALELAYFAITRKNKSYALVLFACIGAALYWKAPIVDRLLNQQHLAMPEQRLTFWSFAYHTFLKNWGFGVGLGSFAQASRTIPQVSTWVHPEHV